jgi:hypothetical protein
MKKILIISYCELKDHLLSIENCFTQKLKWIVDYYPLYMYCFDKFSRIENYENHFSEYITKSNPDVILWWFTDVPYQVFERIKNENPKIFFIMYNSNDPVNVNNTFLNKCKIFNVIMSPCKHHIHLYKMYCPHKYVGYFPIGFDPLLFNEKSKQSKKIHISFVCESMYENFTEQIVPRINIIKQIQKLCQLKKWNFVIYGPETLKSLFPSIYGGEIIFSDLPKIFNQSMINIVSHPIRNKKLHTDQYIIPILASGGIILTDNVRDFETFFNGIVFLYNNLDDMKHKIIHIMDLYMHEPEYVDLIRKKSIEFSKKYSWDKFVDSIYIAYCEFDFDKNVYSSVCCKQKMQEQDFTFDNWKKKYINGVHYICHSIVIPPNFDSHDYAEKNNFDSCDLINMYVDWWNNGKNKNFLKNNLSNNYVISGEKMNIMTSTVFDFFHIFNKINSPIPEKKNKGLQYISKLSDRNPNVRINDLLKNWIDILSCECT